MQRLSTWVELKVAPEGFARAIENVLCGHSYRMEALRDLATCRGYVGSSAALALYDVPWVPVFLGVIFILHPMQGFVATGGAIVLFVLTLLNELITSPLTKEANTAAINSQRRADSIARNAEAIDSMGMMPAVMRRWQESVAEMMTPQRRAAQRGSVLSAMAKFVRLGVQIAVLGVGAYLVLQHELTSGALIAGSIIMGRALAPVEMLIGGWKQFVQVRQAFSRLQTFLRQPRLRPPGLPLPEPVGRLSVERVTYAFPNTTSTIVKGVQFTLNPGESLAVIGPSAAGKSTLIKMLIGTLAPSAGAVRLDGADVHGWMREDFGRYVGYLPQAVELFEGTVFRNIARMGDARPEQVFAAAQLAGCHEMIMRLPLGYETEIGENGQFLSGGQRQLIGLARALFGNPKFVVLDEPNSNLDGESEKNLIGALEKLKALETTVVLVSHRPGLVQHVDLVLMMRDGAVEMFGPRTDVLNRVIARPALDKRPTTEVSVVKGYRTGTTRTEPRRIMTQLHTLPQNIAVPQLEQPIPLLPWMNAPHPPTRSVVLLGLISMAVFIGGFSAWSFFAPLAEAAIAEGVISVEGEHRVIANQEGGSVQELLVRDGDHVRAGQVLIRMNDAQASATAETAKAQRWTLLAQLARLDSEAAGDGKIRFQSELLAAAGGPGLDAARAADAMSVQRALFEARTVSLNSQISVLQDRIDQQLAVISSAEQQQQATQQQLDLIQREVDVKQTLLSKGLARLSEVLQLQRSEAALNGTLGDLAGQIQRARATIAESRSSMRQTRDQRLQDVSDDRREARSKLNETEDNLRAAKDVAVRRDVVAPEDGTILSMRIFNVGAVVKPGDTVMELVPSHDRLVAHVKLSPNDIDVVYPGLNTLIRLPAFKQRLVPSLDGRVIFVASDVTTDEKTKDVYYKTQILLDRHQLDHLPNVHLTPGMPVEAMVQLGERSFFHYITQPIRDSFRRAFTEQ